MKGKKKIEMLERIMRRFKKISLAFIALFGIQWLVSYTIKQVKDLEVGENEAEYGSFFFVDAAAG